VYEKGDKVKRRWGDYELQAKGFWLQAISCKLKQYQPVA